jgi:hypothetical protein
MMEPISTAAVAAAITSIVVKAAEKLGDKLFDTATDAAADETTGLARRLISRLLHRGQGASTQESTQVALRDALDGVVVSPQDTDAQASVRITVRRLLEQDPQLLDDVRALLPASATASGARSVAVGGDNPGTIITGDSNTVQR